VCVSEEEENMCVRIELDRFRVFLSLPAWHTPRRTRLLPNPEERKAGKKKLAKPRRVVGYQ